jgi:hypothetical protein
MELALSYMQWRASVLAMLTFRDLWVPEALSPWVKRPGREADHSTPYSAEVKNVWSYTSTAPYVFMSWCLVKYRTRLHGVLS